MPRNHRPYAPEYPLCYLPLALPVMTVIGPSPSITSCAVMELICHDKLTAIFWLNTT